MIRRLDRLSAFVRYQWAFGPVRTNPPVLQAISRANALKLLQGSFTLKLKGFRRGSLLRDGCRSNMVNPDNTRLPGVVTVGPVNRLGNLRINFLVRLRYHSTRQRMFASHHWRLDGDTGVAAR